MYKVVLMGLSVVIMFGGCAKQPIVKEREGGVDKEMQRIIEFVDENKSKRETENILVINSLKTLKPTRTKEIIMRGVMLPYELNQVQHDSSFKYIVIKEKSWKKINKDINNIQDLIGGLND